MFYKTITTNKFMKTTMFPLLWDLWYLNHSILIYLSISSFKRYSCNCNQMESSIVLIICWYCWLFFQYNAMRVWPYNYTEHSKQAATKGKKGTQVGDRGKVIPSNQDASGRGNEGAVGSKRTGLNFTFLPKGFIDPPSSPSNGHNWSGMLPGDGKLSFSRWS